MASRYEGPCEDSVEGQLAAVLECAPLILWAANADGKITLSVGSGLSAFGIAPGDAVGQSLWEVHAGRPDVLAAVRSALQGARGRSEARIDGRFLVGELFPLRNASGAVSGVLGVTMDVTERTEVERASHETAARYRALVEQQPDIVWTSDSSGRPTFVNDAVTRILGYAPGDLVGTNVSSSDLVHPEDLGVWRERLDALVARDVPLDYEARFRARNGEWIWLRIRSIARYERDGSLWIDGIATNVSRAKRAEEALRREEGRLRALIGSIPDTMWTARETGEIVYLSDASKLPGQLSNVRFDRPGNRFADHIVREDQDIVLRAWRDMFANGRPFDVEYRVPGSDGQVCYVHARAQKPYWRDGQLLVDGIVSDVTHRRRAEQALRESEERLRQLAEHTDAVYCVATVGLGEILYVNPAYETLFGRSCEDLYRNPQSFLEALPDEDRELAVRRMGEQLQGHFRRDELRVVRPDGEVRWMEARGYPIRNERGDVYRVAILAEDITETKQALARKDLRRRQLERAVRERTREIRVLERERAASEKLAAAGRMAARIAHEINNPLSGVRNAFLLVKDAVSEDHPYHHFVERIEREIDRIAEIVRQMYDLYAEGTAEPTMVDVSSVITDVIELVRTVAREGGVTIETDLCEAPCRAQLVQGELRQILYNLVHNAVDASPPDDTVRVRLECDGEHFVLRVSDRGEGIPDAVRERLFEPFFTTKTRTGRPGLGLGLSVTKGLVERMKGQITFASRPGGGTEFRVRLPRNLTRAERELFEDG